MGGFKGAWPDSQEGNCHHLSRPFSLTSIQLSKAAAERNEASHARFMFQIGAEKPERLVFIDESRIDARTTYRNYGRAPKGQQARMKARFVRGPGYVFVL